MQGGKHSAAAYSELEKWAYGSCVASLTSFVASAGTGMNLNISTGAGIISDTIARRIGTDAVETATVPTASVSFNRIDALVAYIDTAISPTTAVTDNTNDILKFVVVSGTASGSPSAPNDSAIVTAIGAGKPFMRLYNVTVPQNATNTSGMTLSDQRVVLKTPDIPNGIVTTAKYADNSLTVPKLNLADFATPQITYFAGITSRTRASATPAQIGESTPITYTSKTGKVKVSIAVCMSVSTQTGNAGVVRSDTSAYLNMVSTNRSAADNMMGHQYIDVPVGVAVTYTPSFASQSGSGTTTIYPYNSQWLSVEDVIAD